MLITVTTTSQKLTEILGTQQDQLNLYKEGDYKLVIQNLGATDIYFDFNADVSTATGIKVSTDSTVSLNTNKVGKMHLISDTSDNNNVRIASN